MGVFRDRITYTNIIRNFLEVKEPFRIDFRGPNNYINYMINPIDIAVLVLLVWLVAVSGKRGMFKELLGLAAFVISFTFAALTIEKGSRLARRIISYLERYFVPLREFAKNETFLNVLGFLMTFVVLSAGFAFFMWLLKREGIFKKLSKKRRYAAPNRFFGILIGVIKGVAWAMVLVVALYNFSPDGTYYMRRTSRFVAIINPFLAATPRPIREKLPEFVVTYIDNLKREVEEIRLIK
ncbi:MAG: CvpA family protein [bacterium]